MLYLEDFEIGRVTEFGSHTLTAEEMIAFARQFDPQPFHVSPEAARESFYGGLIASGWHTVGLFMRMIVEGYLLGAASLGSPGVDEVRWLKPVRPGDTLRARVRVVAVEPSRSKPDRGVMRSHGEMLNQRDEVVLSLKGMGMFLRRPPG